MLNEEEEPRTAARLLVAPALDRLGLEELQAYVVALQGEIARVEGEIARKAGHRSAADAFFKTP